MDEQGVRPGSGEAPEGGRSRPPLSALRARALGEVSTSRTTPGLGARSAPTSPRPAAAGAAGGAGAVLPPEAEAFAAAVAARVPGLERDHETVGLPAFRVAREHLEESCRTLRDDPDLALDYLACCSGVDYRDRIDVVYHCFSIRHPGRGVVLKCAAPKDPDGTEGGELPWLPSVTGIWAGANWHEREIFDLLGVRFRGHPDLRRILMPEGFDGGYPLRKDFVDRREQRERKVRPR
jgi:NADH-quinone oxidoreductase subunit C